MLAEACGRAGEPEEGLRALAEAFAVLERTGERRREAEVHRLKGELLLLLPGRDEAAAATCFGRALAIARNQSAKALELRAAMSLARLWRDRGKRAEARDLVAPIYGWFTEGFDSPDLRDAKALLDELQ